MSSHVRLAMPAPGTLVASAKLIAVVLVAGLLAQAIGGTTASITVGLASGSAMAFGTVMPTRIAVVVTLVLGAAAALGAAAYGDARLAGLAVALMVLVTAPATAYSAGMLVLAPLLTLLYAVNDRGWPWWEAFLWGVAGGVVGLVLAALMKFGKKPPSPLPWGLAWRHAVVLAIAVGVSIMLAESLSAEGHGYWVAVTLLVALRPVPGERTSYVIQRIWGTLLGSVIALVTVLVVPVDLLMLAAFVYLVVLAAYAMSVNYFMQTVFLTPMLMIFMSASEKDTAIELTLGRVLYTFIGVLLAAALAWLMSRWDRSSGLLEDESPELAVGTQPQET